MRKMGLVGCGIVGFYIIYARNSFLFFFSKNTYNIPPLSIPNLPKAQAI